MTRRQPYSLDVSHCILYYSTQKSPEARNEVGSQVIIALELKEISCFRFHDTGIGFSRNIFIIFYLNRCIQNYLRECHEKFENPIILPCFLNAWKFPYTSTITLCNQVKKLLHMSSKLNLAKKKETNKKTKTIFPRIQSWVNDRKKCTNSI